MAGNRPPPGFLPWIRNRANYVTGYFRRPTPRAHSDYETEIVSSVSRALGTPSPDLPWRTSSARAIRSATCRT